MIRKFRDFFGKKETPKPENPEPKMAELSGIGIRLSTSEDYDQRSPIFGESYEDNERILLKMLHDGDLKYEYSYVNPFQNGKYSDDLKNERAADIMREYLEKALEKNPSFVFESILTLMEMNNIPTDIIKFEQDFFMGSFIPKGRKPFNIFDIDYGRKWKPSVTITFDFYRRGWDWAPIMPKNFLKRLCKMIGMPIEKIS